MGNQKIGSILEEGHVTFTIECYCPVTYFAHLATSLLKLGNEVHNNK
jgi:hypothetical protein